MPQFCDIPTPDDTVTASSSPHESASQLLTDTVVPYTRPKQLKRHHFTSDYLTPETSTGTSTPDTTASNERPAKRRKKVHSSTLQVQIKPGTLTSPRSQFIGWRPTLPVVPEAKAINDLRLFWNNEDHPHDEFNIWRLEEFSIYRTKTDFRLPGELAPLHHLNVETRVNELLFDGILTVYGEKRLVHGAAFTCVTVDGYNDESDQVSICIQSKLGSKAKVWFELGAPAKEYIRYYEPYLWIAHFGKYFVEWLAADDLGSLTSFRSRFFPSISQKYGNSVNFKSWQAQYGSQDFRQALCANIGYLFKECWSLDEELTRRSIWQEVDPQRLNAIPEQPSVVNKTVVTPFVFECFQNMSFASQLQTYDFSSELTLKRRNRRTELGLTPIDSKPTAFPDAMRPVTEKIRLGDVVSVDPDPSSRWKTSEDSRWYAYVQNVRTLRSGDTKLDLIWLYEPLDTTLGQGYYPWKNELFFSDNCSCGMDAIDASAVRFKVDVNWFVEDPSAQTCFFVRKKFRTEHTEGLYDFVQLRESDLRCSCSRSEPDQFQHGFKVGDTVLVEEIFNGKEVLEPAEILRFSGSDQSVILRKFHRCYRDLSDTHARPNQIVPAIEPCITQTDAIIRKCNIAFLSSADDLKSPYDKDGAGDFWFVLDQAISPTDDGGPTQPVSSPEVQNKLKGMGIFCGGGSFDRGLEEGGGVEFRYAVDWAKHALHTYRANLKDPEDAQLWLGSVNDYLAKALQAREGSANARVAGVGEVDVIAAGSPCPGFSTLQQNKQSDKSLQNCSLVASVCAYVDFYMPLYLVLENVLGMALNVKGKEDQNVFSQVLCCLTAMGYQVQQFLMDPGHFGSCQSRTRIFVVATAPNPTPLRCPPQTHSSPQLERLGKSIGRSSNGLPFGKRRTDTCPFPFLSAKDAMHDLPDTLEGHVQTCIKFPDHRLCRQENVEKRVLMSSIPRWPFGQGFMQAHLAGVMPQKQVQEYAWKNKYRSHPGSRSWARTYPDRLVGCITTSIKPHDAWGGRVVHYDQPRTLSVMEARRVQSFLDSEVVIGIPTQQWKIIGNSVDRKVAFALGLRLAEAWNSSNLDSTSSPSTNFGNEEQLASIISPAKVVDSAPEVTPDDTQHRARSTETDDTRDIVEVDDSPEPIETLEVMVIDDPDEPVETDEPKTLNDADELVFTHQTVEEHLKETQTPDTCTRRNMRGSSARLIVPTNFAAKPERARTHFL